MFGCVIRLPAPHSLYAGEQIIPWPNRLLLNELQHGLCRRCVECGERYQAKRKAYRNGAEHQPKSASGCHKWVDGVPRQQRRRRLVPESTALTDGTRRGSCKDTWLTHKYTYATPESNASAAI